MWAEFEFGGWCGEGGVDWLAHSNVHTNKTEARPPPPNQPTSPIQTRYAKHSDGLKVDDKGNLWATGPGGVLVLTPEGRQLGTLLTGACVVFVWVYVFIGL